MVAKTNFVPLHKMLIYAKQRKNGAADMIFFFIKRCLTDI